MSPSNKAPASSRTRRGCHRYVGNKEAQGSHLPSGPDWSAYPSSGHQLQAGVAQAINNHQGCALGKGQTAPAGREAEAEAGARSRTWQRREPQAAPGGEGSGKQVVSSFCCLISGQSQLSLCLLTWEMWGWAA